MNRQCALYRKVYDTYYKEVYVRATLFLRNEEAGAAITENLFRKLTKEIKNAGSLEGGKEWLLKYGVSMALDHMRQKEKSQYQFVTKEILSQFEGWKRQSCEMAEEILKMVIQSVSRKERRLFYIFMAEIYEIPRSKIAEKLNLAESEIAESLYELWAEVLDRCEIEWIRRGWIKRTNHDLEGER